MTVVHVAIGILVPIGHDNVAAIGFHLYKKLDPLCDRHTDTHHKQRLAQCPTSFPQHFVRVERDDVAQREDKRVHIFHVEVICRNRIGHGILSQNLREFQSIPAGSQQAIDLMQ